MTNHIIKSAKRLNIEKKIFKIQNIIERTLISSQKYKLYDILGVNELNICMSTLNSIFEETTKITNDANNNVIAHDNALILIENVEEELLTVIKNFGTETVEDLIYLIIGQDYINENFIVGNLSDKFDIINTCCHPINYKIMLWKNENNDNKKKQLQKNRIIEDYMITEQADNLECFDLARTSNHFKQKYME